MISRDGVIIRIAAESIRLCSRPSKGVTVMKLSGDDKVVTLATAPHEEEKDETPEVAETEGEETEKTTEE
jgi:DNA gyrase subunit A